MTGQPIWRERLQGVGVITAQEAIALGATGPILRSTGIPWDLRRDLPYLYYAGRVTRALGEDGVMRYASA